MLLDALNPTEWDRLYYNDREALHAYLKAPEPALAIRRAHAYLHIHQSPKAVLEQLEGVDAPPALGLKLLALCTMGQYGEVKETGFEPRGSSPLELEEAVYGEWAVSMAYAETGSLRKAACRLERAIAFATCLKLEGRLKVLKIEQVRQSSMTGEVEGDAGLVVEDVLSIPNPQVALFGQEVFLGKLLNQDLRVVEKTHQRRLSRQLGDLKAALKREPAVFPRPSAFTEFNTRYVGLLNASVLTIRQENTLARLSVPPDPAPDYAAWTSALLWALWLRTGEANRARPLALPGDLHRQLDTCGDTVGMASWLTYLVPEEMMVLKLGGLGHPDVCASLVTHPVLGHRKIYFGGISETLHEGITDALIHDGLEGTSDSYESLYRSYKQRYRDVLTHHGVLAHEVINPGTLKRLASRFAAYAERYGRGSDTEAALEAVRQARLLLPEKYA